MASHGPLRLGIAARGLTYMTSTPIRRAALLASTLLMTPALATAKTPVTTAPATTDKRIFVPADFARFAPRTAFDMLGQVPGFTIRGADQERGLGQASENVLINGQRVANKSGGAIADLQKVTAANVERIEIVDAAQLGLAGLSGAVANVVLKTNSKGSGRFEYKPEFRAHFTTPGLLRGSASFSDKLGPVDYTLGVESQDSRGGFGGPVTIDDASGNRIETRTQQLNSDFTQPKFSARLKLDAPGSSVANLNASYAPYWYRLRDSERRLRTDGDHRDRLTRSRQVGFNFDLTGDYEFALGPGRLKAIALRHFEHEPTVTTQVTRFDSGAPATGVRFDRDARIGETIGRLEYGWKMGRNDVQLTLERADNRLAQVGRLFLLSPTGTFDEVPFPDGSGIVAETRYEGSATLSRPLSPRLDLQIVLGAERSTLSRVDGNVAPRRFVRPKGSLVLGWRPAKGWDTSLTLRRRVGQISFYDFLAQPNLQQDRDSAGNPDLVPPQSWEAEVEVGRELGRWGKTRLNVYAHRIEDIIDIIPIGEDGEAVGNLPRATRFGLESKSTFLLDPIGWHGAKVDLNFGLVQSQVRDPLLGTRRAISDTEDRWVNLNLRHDIPHSKIAWGGSAQYGHSGGSFYLSEVNRGSEGPVMTSLFVEHKDVAGLTVRASVANLANLRRRSDRTVYAGRRNDSPILFVQRGSQLVGPIFGLSIKGNF